MEQVYLIDCVYESEKQRIITYFSKDPYNRKSDFIFKEKFNPFFYIDLSKELVTKLLSDFNKEIKIEKIKNKLKITAKNKETLNKCYKIISMATSKKILLIDTDRQYLIDKKWSYYDLFVIISRTRIKKIEINNVSSVVKKYINPFLKEEQIKLIENLTKKVLLSNLLKIKPSYNLNNSEIMNILFENIFFENKITLENNTQIEYLKKDAIINHGIKMDFSSIWPYLLTKEFYNLGHDTINCSCCKPTKYTDINVLLSSTVKVNFKKQGYYFISKDKKWAEKYHLENKDKKARLNFKKNNKLIEMPVGPFFINDTKELLLIDSYALTEEDDVNIIGNNDKLNWYCLKEESCVSKTINFLLKKLKNVESSINLSTSITYKSSFKNSTELERNPLFIQYLTEYKLINDLISAIPVFIEHKNTKFYNRKLSLAIKFLKYDLIQKIDVENSKYIIDKERVIVKEKKFLEKVNNYFPKINLPIPKLIKN
jgi:hypothetical protein